MNKAIKSLAVPAVIAGAAVAPFTVAYCAVAGAAGYITGAKLKAAGLRAQRLRDEGYNPPYDGALSASSRFVGDMTQIASILCPVLPFVAEHMAEKLNAASNEAERWE